ncbi:periplasmic heavy metal sensor [Aquabacter sp. CN5-332]|uniref:periplasmic heavy metal sensor n=1 Tax=Aquabacter sp. CN5-332 TaxID=3156608 RepID=UPI0032B3883D
MRANIASPAWMPPQRLLLVASIALNLFFLGCAAAMVVRPAPSPVIATSVDHSPTARIAAIAATLPPADARILYEKFRAAEPEINAEQAVSEKAQSVVRQTLTAEPFDPEAATRALATLQTTRRDLWHILHGVAVEAATQMSADGRARLAGGLPPNAQRTSPNQAQ